MPTWFSSITPGKRNGSGYPAELELFCGTTILEEQAMANKQQQGKRETKKPKKNKDERKDPASLSRGISAASAPPKKKG